MVDQCIGARTENVSVAELGAENAGKVPVWGMALDHKSLVDDELEIFIDLSLVSVDRDPPCSGLPDSPDVVGFNTEFDPTGWTLTDASRGKSRGHAHILIALQINAIYAV